MHPTPAFRFDSTDEMRAFVSEHAFATIAAVIDGRIAIAQAPIVVDGDLEPTDDALLSEILIRESAIFEGRIANKRPWTIDKLAPETLAAKMRGIVGVVLMPRALRGTSKLSQNKTREDREGVIAALVASPRERERNVAEAMRQRQDCDDAATGPAEL